jgi:hypothetical protein
MKTDTLLLMACMATLALAAPLSAQAQASDQSGRTQAQIVERGPDGKASVVRIDGRNYPVCNASGARQDGCIEPRSAGLKWGDRPLKYWPGKPASQIDGDQGHIPN